MKRPLFFWLEKLKISRNERYAIFTLMITLSGLALGNAAIHPRPLFDDKQYAALDQQFKARTAQMQAKQMHLMAKYHPEKERLLPVDTLRKDTVSKKKRALKSNSSDQKFINVNTANEKMLQKLRGIGPAYARRIVVYRRKNGPFKNKDELIKIKGIGEKRLAKIKPFIKLTAKQ